MIDQTLFLSTVFLCSEFKLQYVYTGVIFLQEKCLRQIFLRELIFAER